MVIRLSLVLFLVVPFRSYAGNELINEAVLRSNARKIFKGKVEPFVNKYCVKCHGSRPKGGVNLQSALKNPNGESATLNWKKAVANVKVHDMPPEDTSKIPSEEDRRQFIESVSEIKYLAPRDPGPFVLRRLTKTEYANTLAVLYGVDRSIADGLPDEIVGEGFLNTISPLQSELFLGIANQVIEEVITPEGQTPTAVQKRLFGALPPKGADLRKEARKVARFLAREAYRRPASKSELDVLVDIYDLGRNNDLDYTGALSLMLKAVLVSPQFLFITPASDPKFSKERIVFLDDYQLAARLSYLLWSAPPDGELAALADKGELHKKVVLQAQAERLLKDKRARALFDGFGAQWLRINELKSQVFDPKTFPQMTPLLRTAMSEEVRLFFESIVRENLSVARFVDSDYTFLNEPLAKIYGVTQPVPGPKMRRVKLENPDRGGILGMPATLAATSLPNRTSPVRRGVWVLEQVLGERVPSPPPDIPELEEQEHKEIEGLTLRQRTELHQSEETCRNCHKVLDPIGFGLENFDAIGRWRDKNDEGLTIDSAGKLPNGLNFSSPAELKNLLAKRERDLARNLTERLVAYALGRPLGGYDGIVIDRILANVAKEGFRTRSIISEVITSYLFTYRRIKK
ncbi:MAG: DUF1592 domain-containing protein [Opitutae bacterium]|nr:DUF1592 domain-containing protein [Opitutae bacterium]